MERVHMERGPEDGITPRGFSSALHRSCPSTVSVARPSSQVTSTTTDPLLSEA